MKNRFLTALISAILCVAMICPALAEEIELVLPEKLRVIEAEAFAGTGAVEKVVVREATKRIESRAFAGSSAEEIYLPESVEFIAEDAFEGCENLTLYVPKGSYAHKWAAFRSIDYVVVTEEEPEEEKYRISSLESDGNMVSAAVTTENACVLRVNVLKEADESLISTFTMTVEGKLEAEKQRITLGEDLPQYFILEAVLEDENGNALCKALRDISRTGAYAQFEASKPEDYPAERVMDFGEAGFAVLAEGVVNVTEEATASGSGYTIPTEAFGGKIPAKGDVVMLHVNGVPTPVKVGSVAVSKGDTVRIEADSEIYLCDAFDSVKIGVYAEGGEDGSGAGVKVTLPLEESYTSKNKMLTVNANGGVTVAVSAQYDKKILGRDYFKLDAEANVVVDVVGTLKGEYATEENEIKLDLYSGTFLIPGINLPATMDVTLPVNMGVEGEGSLTVHYEKLAGFSWDTKNGFVEKESPNKNYVDHELQVQFHADAGPEVTLGFSFFEFFGANVSGQIGVNVVGTLTGKAHAGYVPPVEDDEIHACDLCLGVDVDLFAKADASIYYSITEELSDDLLDEEIFNLPLFDLKDMYVSIINEKESVFGGTLTEGDGFCPNYKYKVNVSTVDMEDKAVTGLPVSITGSNGSAESLVSPGEVHLYDANYTAEATFDSGVAKETFSVVGAPVKVVIREEEMTVEGTVTDSKTLDPISGAVVKMTLPDGSTKTTVTNASGFYKFDKLLGGTYSFTFSKDNYESKTFSDMKYVNGSRNKLNVQLKPGDLPMLSASTSESTRIQAVTADGTCPAHLPQVWIETTIPSGGYGTSVKVHHSDCAKTLNISYSQAIYSISIKAANMGESEYIYLLSASSAGRMGGADHTIFRVKNGEFVILGEFDMDTHSMDIPIYLNAVFTSATELTGTIEPKGISFVATFTSSDSGRVGRKTSRRRLGYMSFVENEDGYYDLQFTTDEFYEFIRTEFFGTTYNRFVMEDGQLVLKEQSLKINSGTVTYP